MLSGSFTRNSGKEPFTISKLTHASHTFEFWCQSQNQFPSAPNTSKLFTIGSNSYLTYKHAIKRKAPGVGKLYLFEKLWIFEIFFGSGP